MKLQDFHVGQSVYYETLKIEGVIKAISTERGEYYVIIEWITRNGITGMRKSVFFDEFDKILALPPIIPVNKKENRIISFLNKLERWLLWKKRKFVGETKIGAWFYKITKRVQFKFCKRFDLKEWYWT